MLVALEAHFAEISVVAEQALVDSTLDVFHAAAFAEGAFVSGKTVLPSLEIFVDDYHWVLELPSAHWAGHC